MIWFLIGLLIGAVPFASAWMASNRRMRLLDEEKQLIAQEKEIVVEFMHNMVQAVGEGIDREELFQRIVHAAVISTGALSACIFEKTPNGRLRGVAVEGLFPPHRPLPDQSKIKLTTRAKFIEQVLKSETFDIGDGVVGTVAKTGKAMLIENAAADPKIVRHDDPALAVKSLIAAPIIFRDEMIGVLAVANPADGLPFNQTDLSLVQSLAEQSGLAVHNAEFLKLSLEKKQLDLDIALASSIQSLILPREFPVIPGLEIDAFFRPAQQLGGDLYDCFRLDDGRVAAAIADVSGKGIAASIYMAICRTNLRRVCNRHSSPSAVLSELNSVMQGEMREGMFITMILAFVDCSKDEIVFARAGHELPILCHAESDGCQVTSEMPGGEGMPIGMVESDVFEDIIADCTLRFVKGDVFCLYTDGVTEAAEDDKEFGSARLADYIKTFHTRSARDINAGIVEAVQRFTGKAEGMDDMTLLTLRRT
jgi:sigma-B regulation protein RsbU (phosphoserine phosphatase)